MSVKVVKTRSVVLLKPCPEIVPGLKPTPDSVWVFPAGHNCIVHNCYQLFESFFGHTASFWEAFVGVGGGNCEFFMISKESNFVSSLHALLRALWIMWAVVPVS